MEHCNHEWNDRYQPFFELRIGFFNHYHDDYAGFYRGYWGPEYHFWGFGWRSEGVVVDNYFWNPAFFYFYADHDQWDDRYFSGWYGQSYSQYPEFQNRFRRPRVFYPTLAFADLTVGVSAWEAYRQLAFRRSLSDLIVRIETDLSWDQGRQVILDQGSVEIDHYQLLQNALVLEGVISSNDQGYPFKSFIDLSDTDRNIVFVTPFRNEQPSSTDISKLEQLNSRIIQAGGVLEDATDQIQDPAQPVVP